MFPFTLLCTIRQITFRFCIRNAATILFVKHLSSQTWTNVFDISSQNMMLALCLNELSHNAYPLHFQG